ncbi:hypothetical protein LTS18_011195 [Coniosporium uncinatum]|uniref:Uncharacterized protein n=1 Tax=Coniosporium uncinatum TaxID=93489 RepID=A0ACC3D9T6_9PEZI|nr:hypothetical protein LTS18_011195 [Coniosporium uncinatum]
MVPSDASVRNYGTKEHVRLHCTWNVAAMDGTISVQEQDTVLSLADDYNWHLTKMEPSSGGGYVMPEGFHFLKMAAVPDIPVGYFVTEEGGIDKQYVVQTVKLVSKDGPKKMV